jgi:hypothetical protein
LIRVLNVLTMIRILNSLISIRNIYCLSNPCTALNCTALHCTALHCTALNIHIHLHPPACVPGMPWAMSVGVGVVWPFSVLKVVTLRSHNTHLKYAVLIFVVIVEITN